MKREAAGDVKTSVWDSRELLPLKVGSTDLDWRKGLIRVVFLCGIPTNCFDKVSVSVEKMAAL